MVITYELSATKSIYAFPKLLLACPQEATITNMFSECIYNDNFITIMFFMILKQTKEMHCVVISNTGVFSVAIDLALPRLVI